MARLNTALAAQGAEFLVLANLLISGIECHKCYTHQPGYDLVAVHPANGTACRISVKSRYASDYDGGFPLQNLDCDVVVLVALNQGVRYRKSRSSAMVSKDTPDCFVVPIELLAGIRQPQGWNKVFLRALPGGPERYRNQWSVIRQYLQAI